MSKKNIIDRKDDGKKVTLTFENEDGNRTYEFKGSSARAIRRGTDPSGLTGGKLVHHEKKEK